jgi:hypothetical protein
MRSGDDRAGLVVLLAVLPAFAQCTSSGHAPTDAAAAALAARAECPGKIAMQVDSGVVADPFPVPEFCALFVDDCGANATDPNLKGESSCETEVASWTPVQQGCRAYHLCVADGILPGSERDLHCGHAEGIGACP